VITFQATDEVLNGKSITFERLRGLAAVEHRAAVEVVGRWFHDQPAPDRVRPRRRLVPPSGRAWCSGHRS
jgi:hypothetical protein